MRLFTAIELPAHIADELSLWQDRLSGTSINIRGQVKFVRRDNLHMTLGFLGEVSDNQLSEVRQALKSVEIGVQCRCV